MLITNFILKIHESYKKGVSKRGSLSVPFPFTHVLVHVIVTVKLNLEVDKFNFFELKVHFGILVYFLWISFIVFV